jgi:phage shock protein A
LIRGQAAEAEEALEDRHAFTLLDQRIRESGQAVLQARRALALAEAGEAADAARLASVAARRDGLEAAARDALRAGQEALATEAAAAIGALEQELETARASADRFKLEAASLRKAVTDAQARLEALVRGRRLARSTEAIHALQARIVSTGSAGLASLREAEATLSRLRERQAVHQAVQDELGTLEPDGGIDSRLQAAGFGPPNPHSAQAVLSRLRASIQTPENERI